MTNPISIQRGTRKAGSVVFSAKKASAGTIEACKAVYITDIDEYGIFLIEPSSASASLTMPSWGVTAEEIDNIDDGAVILSGFLYNVDTSDLDAGYDLYVSEINDGYLTQQMPDGTQYAVEPVAGVVKSHPTNGILEIYNVGLSVHAKRLGGDLHSEVTQSSSGFMSASDKIKLDELEAGSESNPFVYKETITSWTLSGGLYYKDITHGMGTEDVAVQAYAISDNKTIGLEEIERISTDVIRIWVGVEENIRILAMSTPTRDYYSSTASSWTPSGDFYYSDVSHNQGSNDLVIHTYLTSNNKTVGMEDLERIDTNTLRVWSSTNTENVRVVIFKI